MNHHRIRMGRGTLPRSIDDLPKKIILKNNLLAGKHSPRQARNVWVTSPNPITTEIKRKQALVSAFFIAGAGFARSVRPSGYECLSWIADFRALGTDFR